MPPSCPSCRLFQQPLVPVVSVEDGRWLLTAPLQPLMKPGGHGVIWKLMLDSGVFGWLREHDRQAAIVRQIRWVWGLHHACLVLYVVAGLVKRRGGRAVRERLKLGEELVTGALMACVRV